MGAGQNVNFAGDLAQLVHFSSVGAAFVIDNQLANAFFDEVFDHIGDVAFAVGVGFKEALLCLSGGGG